LLLIEVEKEDVDTTLKEQTVEALDCFITSDPVRCALAGLGIRTRPWLEKDNVDAASNPLHPQSIVGTLVSLLDERTSSTRTQHLVAITLANLAQAPQARCVIAEHPEALTSLSLQLRSNDHFCKYWAAQAIAVMAADGEAADSPDEAIAQAKACAYEATLAAVNFPDLVALLKDTFPLSRRGAAEALEKICTHDAMRDETLRHISCVCSDPMRTCLGESTLLGPLLLWPMATKTIVWHSLLLGRFHRSWLSQRLFQQSTRGSRNAMVAWPRS